MIIDLTWGQDVIEDFTMLLGKKRSVVPERRDSSRGRRGNEFRDHSGVKKNIRVPRAPPPHNERRG